MNWFIFVLVTVCYGLYGREVGLFFKKQLGCAGKEAEIFAVFCFLGCMVEYGIVEKWYVPFIIRALVEHLLFAGAAVLMFKAGTEKKITMAVMLVTVRVLVGNFSSSFLSCLILLIKNAWNAGGNVYISQTEGELAGCFSFGVVIWAIHCLGRPFGAVLDNKIRKWYLLLTLPLVLLVLLVDIVNYGASIGILVVAGMGSSGEYWKEFYNELFSHTAIGILTALSMCAAGFYVFGMNRIYVEQRKKEQYRSQAAFYKMLEEQYGQLERLRHDMKNHIIGLRGLWESREWEKLGAYLEQMMEAGMPASEENTGSGAVDALLYQKHRQAKERQIAWECDIQIPGKCPIDEFDLCVLLGNMLDNALAACEKAGSGDKFVSIHAGQVKKCLLLEVRNNTVLKDIKDICPAGRPLTGEHGIGLLNIRDTVGKYDGAMHVEAEDGVFTISLLLPLNAAYDMKQTF